MEERGVAERLLVWRLHTKINVNQILPLKRKASQEREAVDRIIKKPEDPCLVPTPLF
jgi:hypothetical protein